jgi:transposase-like protein
LIRKNRRYSREFKLEAVRLTEEEGRAVSEVARELGIPRYNLYNWRSQLREEIDSQRSLSDEARGTVADL